MFWYRQFYFASRDLHKHSAVIPKSDCTKLFQPFIKLQVLPMKKLLMPFTLLSALMLTVPANAGMASWYGPGFHGKRTASGAIYNMYAMTAAHKSLPFGSKVKVTNLNNNKSVVVKINDRGPFKPGRVIELTKKANQMINCNLCKVDVEVLSKGDGKYRRR